MHHKRNTFLSDEDADTSSIFQSQLPLVPGSPLLGHTRGEEGGEDDRPETESGIGLVRESDDNDFDMFSGLFGNDAKGGGTEGGGNSIDLFSNFDDMVDERRTTGGVTSLFGMQDVMGEMSILDAANAQRMRQKQQQQEEQQRQEQQCQEQPYQQGQQRRSESSLVSEGLSMFIGDQFGVQRSTLGTATDVDQHAVAAAGRVRVGGVAGVGSGGGGGGSNGENKKKRAPKRDPPPKQPFWGHDPLQKMISAPSTVVASQMGSVAATLREQQQQRQRQRQQQDEESPEQEDQMADLREIAHTSDHARAHTHRPTLQQSLQAANGPQAQHAVMTSTTLLQRAVDIMIERPASMDATLRSLLAEMHGSLHALVLGNLLNSMFAERTGFGGRTMTDHITPSQGMAVLLKVFFGSTGSTFVHSRGASSGTLELHFAQPIVPNAALACNDAPLCDALARDCQYAQPSTPSVPRPEQEPVHIVQFVQDAERCRSILLQDTNPLMFVMRRMSERYGVPASAVYLELVDMDVRYPRTWERLVQVTADAVAQTLVDIQRQRQQHQQQQQQQILAPRRVLFIPRTFCEAVQGGMLPWIDYACRLDSTSALSLNDIVRRLAADRRRESFETLNLKMSALLLRSRPRASPFHMHRSVFRYLWTCPTVEPTLLLPELLVEIEKDELLKRLLFYLDTLDDPLEPCFYFMCLIRAFQRKMFPDVRASLRRFELEHASCATATFNDDGKKTTANKKKSSAEVRAHAAALVERVTQQEQERQQQEHQEQQEDKEEQGMQPLADAVGQRMKRWLELRCSLSEAQRKIVDRKFDEIFAELKTAHEETGDVSRDILRKYAMVVERDRWFYPLPVLVRFRRQITGTELDDVANDDNYLNNTPISRGSKYDNHHKPRPERVYYMAIYYAEATNLKQSATVVHLNGPFTDLAFKSPTAAINHVLVGNACSSGPKDLEILVIDDHQYTHPLTDDPKEYRGGPPRWEKLETYVREQEFGRFGFVNMVGDLPATLKRRAIPYKERLDAHKRIKGEFVEVKHENVLCVDERYRTVSQHVHVGALTHGIQQALGTLLTDSTADAKAVACDDAAAEAAILEAIRAEGARSVFAAFVCGSRLTTERDRDSLLSQCTKQMIDEETIVVDTRRHVVALPPHAQMDASSAADLQRISQRQKRQQEALQREQQRQRREKAQADQQQQRRQQQRDLFLRTAKSAADKKATDNDKKKKKKKKKQPTTTTTTNTSSGVKRSMTTAAASSTATPLTSKKKRIGSCSVTSSSRGGNGSGKSGRKRRATAAAFANDDNKKKKVRFQSGQTVATTSSGDVGGDDDDDDDDSTDGNDWERMFVARLQSRRVKK